MLEQMKRKKEIRFGSDAFMGSIFLDPFLNVILYNNFTERDINHIVKTSDKIDTLVKNHCSGGAKNDNSIQLDCSSDCVEAILKTMKKEYAIIGPTNEKLRNLLNGFRKERESREIQIYSSGGRKIKMLSLNFTKFLK